MTTLDDPDFRDRLLTATATIVSAFVSYNAVHVDALPGVVARTFEALRNISLPQQPAEDAPSAPVPAVPIEKSIADDYLVCLEDGKKFKSLKRHLRTQYNLSPGEYRERWGLGPDYPMTAPNYARARSALAKEMGLGQQRTKAVAPALAASSKPARKTSPKPPAQAAA